MLRVLGYTANDIEDHPTLPVEVGRQVLNLEPDYVLLHQRKPTAILELKAPPPGEDLNDPRWVKQLRSYCVARNAPIGVLFNGVEVRLYINTEMKKLERFAERFRDEPVAAGSQSNVKRMVDILANISPGSLRNDPVAVAVRLGGKRLKEIIKEGIDLARQQAIVERIEQIKNVPPDYLLHAIAGEDDAWGDMDQKPTIDQLRTAWVSPSISWRPLKSLTSQDVTWRRPSKFRLPDGTEVPVAKWKYMLVEACKYVLTCSPELQIPLIDCNHRKYPLIGLETLPPKRGEEIYANGQTYQVHITYSAFECVENTIHVLEQAKGISRTSEPAVLIRSEKQRQDGRENGK